MKPLQFVVAGVLFAGAAAVIVATQRDRGPAQGPPSDSAARLHDERVETAYTVQARSELRNLVTLQEGFFTDSGHYLRTIDEVRTAWDRHNGNYRMPPYIRLVMAEGDAFGWRAQIRTPRHLCTVAVGNRNPVGASRDGEPNCVLSTDSTSGPRPNRVVADTQTAKQLLGMIATQEEIFFAESARYTADLTRFERMLGRIDTLHLPVGFRRPVLTLKTTGGWSGLITSSSAYCTVEVGPGAPPGREGVPFCRMR